MSAVPMDSSMGYVASTLNSRPVQKLSSITIVFERQC
jgi:hypothetical protein